MITFAIDERLSEAQMIRDIMTGIDPDGRHFAWNEAAAPLGVAESLRPDIVWVNAEMPGMDGFKIADRIRKASPETNLIFIADDPKHAVKAFAVHASGFVLKPVTEEKIRDEVADLRHPAFTWPGSNLLRVQCFGNFEVFSRSGIVRFSRALSKEAFAYLIDRRGAGCTVSEICSVLWEDRQTDKNLKSQCRVIMAALRKDLAAVGAEEVLVKNWNSWSVDTNRVRCDFYDYLKAGPSESFRGEYMAQYSWAEMTTGVLFDLAEKRETP